MEMSDIMAVAHGCLTVFYLVGSAVILMNIAEPLEELLFGDDFDDDETDGHNRDDE